MRGSGQDLHGEVRDGVLVLTKQNKETHYGMSLAIIAQMTEAFEQAAQDDNMRAVVIDAGGRGFHRGAVMVTEMKSSLADLEEADFRELVEHGQTLGRKIAALPKPVIGMARSGALGGGLEQLLRCDFLYTRDDAEFSFPEVSLGFVAAWGGTQFGGRYMPFRRAQEFLLLGEKISGRDAEAYGLVTRSFPTDEELDQHLADVLARLRYCSPASFAETKRCLAARWAGPLVHGEAVEVDAEVTAMATGDFLKAYEAWQAGKSYDFAQGVAK